MNGYFGDFLKILSYIFFMLKLNLNLIKLVFLRL